MQKGTFGSTLAALDDERDPAVRLGLQACLAAFMAEAYAELGHPKAGEVAALAARYDLRAQLAAAKARRWKGWRTWAARAALLLAAVATVTWLWYWLPAQFEPTPERLAAMVAAGDTSPRALLAAGRGADSQRIEVRARAYTLAHMLALRAPEPTVRAEARAILVRAAQTDPDHNLRESALAKVVNL